MHSAVMASRVSSRVHPSVCRLQLTLMIGAAVQWLRGTWLSGARVPVGFELVR